MRLLRKLLGKPAPSPPAPEHAVLIRFAYGRADLDPLFELESRLERAISVAEVGEYDGNEVAADGSEGTLYMYGPDADALFAVVRGLLAEADFMAGARATLRYGPATGGVREEERGLEVK